MSFLRWPHNDKNSPDEPDRIQRVGVIDIGSNSVRLVIFDTTGRCIRTFFNEKVLAGLGRGLSETGRLNSDGVREAMNSLKRFSLVTQAQQVGKIIAFATAAVREATDGAEFCAHVKAETGFEIKVLSGSDEARYAALGVIAMQPSADGVCGDLGGSSLELSVISQGAYSAGSTYPLGPLALLSKDDFPTVESAEDVVPDTPLPLPKKLLRQIDDVLDGAAETAKGASIFYAVGGAWRAIAQIHMEKFSYPLRLLQHYEMSRDSVLELTDAIRSPDKAMWELINSLSKRRARTLPAAAAVLNRIVEKGNFQTVVVSSYGVREGVLFDSMDERTAQQDPLFAGMRVFVQDNPVNARFGMALTNWLAQAAEQTIPERLARVSCLAADIGARLHPDHRADLAFEWLATAPVTSVTHVERVAVALAVANRYKRSYRHSISEALLKEEMSSKARALGALMRLGADFSGRTEDLLEHAVLEARDACLTLEIRTGSEALVTDVVIKRLRQAAQALDLEARLVSGGVAQSL